MINIEQRKLVHKQIILDLTIRTLERDRQLINHLKSEIALNAWFMEKIKQVMREKINIKRQLYKQGIRIENEKKEDDFATSYEILCKGTTEIIRYSNIALRNWTNEEIKRLLNIKYRTADHK